MSRSLNDLGLIYKKQKKYDFALDYFFEALKIREKSNLKQFALSSLTEISDVYKETGELNKAIPHLKRAAQLASEIHQHAKLANIYKELGQIYKLKGEYDNALEFTEKYIHIIVERQTEERESKINNLQTSLLQEKEQEIERLRNVELKNAYALISEKNKEITDSIQYARRIQKALLASDDLLKTNLGEHFVLYKPKDIVSGDFYWATEVVQSGLNVDQGGSNVVQNGSHISLKSDPLNQFKQPLNYSKRFYLAACDSTGHGVPGAFMSLLNITFLNEAINEKKISEPHLVFNHVRERLIHALSHDGSRDGMDGILVCFDREKNMLTYAAANNGPVLKTKNSIQILPADKMPVGNDGQTTSFSLNTVTASPGDILYLITDGYADQFGGPKGKKFKYKQLEGLINEIAALPLNEQHAELEKRFEAWRGDLEQVDDVLIIGLKL
jgi:serine phosphatase RsbU (regulator of sigma subunit)